MSGKKQITDHVSDERLRAIISYACGERHVSGVLCEHENLDVEERSLANELASARTAIALLEQEPIEKLLRLLSAQATRNDETMTRIADRLDAWNRDGMLDVNIPTTVTTEKA